MATNENKAPRKASLLFTGLALVIAVLLANAFPKALADKQDNPFSLTILHTNDLHAHDQTFQDRGKSVGGLARLGHLARLLHKSTPHCLLIDAGDMFQGTPMFTRYQGEVEVALLNAIGYDMYTIGNHEFDSGGVNLAKQLAEAKFKVLNCNLDTTALPQLNKIVRPSEIVSFDPKTGLPTIAEEQSTVRANQVGFVGAITADIESLSLTRDGVNLKKTGADNDMHSQAWMAPIRAAVQELTAKGLNKIILVTHCGVEADKQLAENIPDVDAIIGGHSHTRLATPVIIKHADGSSTTIVQTGCYGRNLGKLKLSFDQDGRVIEKDTQYHLLPIDSHVSEDKDLADYIQKMAEPLRSLRETILCKADGDFDNFFRSMKNDSALGDLICDSFFFAGKDEGTEITFENRGGIRSRIDPGPVSLEKVEELLPFDNHLVFATVTGAQIRRALEHSISGATAGKFLDVHGLKLAWDPGAEPGKRLVFVLAYKNGVWQPLQEAGKYKIAMTDYSFKGGEGYDFSGAQDVHNTECKLNKYFKEYLASLGTIKPICGERIVAVNSTLIKTLAQRQFAQLPPARKPRCAIFTADKLGVEKLEGASLPLADAQRLHKGMSPQALADELAKPAFQAKLKNYTVLLYEGQKREQLNYNESSLLRQVSQPISKEELLALFSRP